MISKRIQSIKSDPRIHGKVKARRWLFGLYVLFVLFVLFVACCLSLYSCFHYCLFLFSDRSMWWITVMRIAVGY